MDGQRVGHLPVDVLQETSVGYILRHYLPHLLLPSLLPVLAGVDVVAGGLEHCGRGSVLVRRNGEGERWDEKGREKRERDREGRRSEECVCGEEWRYGRRGKEREGRRREECVCGEGWRQGRMRGIRQG